ncbi:SBF-like CPA transporter family-domain-containing protein [Absidia repens]|uniref:SBF-like CPA transporter family-domain-containing protein n=1 Tax=Absidia repens TaxID=90262 RepID=A0A1X2IHK3_9FUNG|nr:SBF-like CPA transporter family-domain-containing protein [Absidia repens]
MISEPKMQSHASFASEVTMSPHGENQSDSDDDMTKKKPLSFSEKSITIASQKNSDHLSSGAPSLVERNGSIDDMTKKGWKSKLGVKSKALLKKYWFLLGLAFVILLATQFPDVARKGGYVHAEWSIKWGAVIVIFLISGLSLRTKILAQTILRVRLHFLIQVVNLILIPSFVFGLVILLLKAHVPLSSLLLIGVVIAASTPTTVSSNVVMTKNAKGNEASALMNAALGNVLGIFVSPALVSTFQTPLLDATPEDESASQVGGVVDFASVLKQLGLTVLVPLVIGQAIQWMFTEKVAKIKEKCRLSDVSSVALLIMVWSVFSDAVYSGSFSAVTAKDIVIIAVINAVFYITFSLTCLLLARLPLPKFINTPDWIKRLRYSREDTVAVMYCGATKTVAMGVPLINVLYQNGDPGTIGVLSTPLLLYHVEQLILGNIEVELLKKWVLAGQKSHKDVLPTSTLDQTYSEKVAEEYDDNKLSRE